VDVLRRSGECPKQNPQGGAPFYFKSKREGDGRRLGRVWEEMEVSGD
jgi:hypothetical protein